MTRTVAAALALVLCTLAPADAQAQTATGSTELSFAVQVPLANSVATRRVRFDAIPCPAGTTFHFKNLVVSFDKSESSLTGAWTVAVVLKQPIPGGRMILPSVTFNAVGSAQRTFSLPQPHEFGGSILFDKPVGQGAAIVAVLSGSCVPTAARVLQYSFSDT